MQNRYFKRLYSSFKIVSPDVFWEIIIFGRRMQFTALWPITRGACFIRMTSRWRYFLRKMARWGRKCSFWYQIVGLSSPNFGIYLKSYHQINVRSVAAKLAEAETVIKGMHSIKRNPITFCIREIKFIFWFGQGQSL